MNSKEEKTLLTKILYNCANGPDDWLLSQDDLKELSKVMGVPFDDIANDYKPWLEKAGQTTLMPFRAMMP